jgi:hypothetical protein
MFRGRPSEVWAPLWVGLRVTALPRPLAEGLIRDGDPTGAQQRFAVAVAKAEAERQPHRVADDLGREAVVFIRVCGC